MDELLCITRCGWTCLIPLPLGNLRFCIHHSNFACIRPIKEFNFPWDSCFVSLVLLFDFPEDTCKYLYRKGLSALLMKVGQLILYLLTDQETPIDGLVRTVTFWYQFQNQSSEEKRQVYLCSSEFPLLFALSEGWCSKKI